MDRASASRSQQIAESILLAVIGGVVGVLAGAVATVVYASTKGWSVVIPVEAWLGGITLAILIGAFDGLKAGHSSVSDAAYRGIANGMTMCRR